MKSGFDIIFDVYRRLLGFYKKFSDTAKAEGIIRGLGRRADLYCVFVDYFFIGFGVALFVGNIPAKNLKKWVKKFLSELGFVVGGRRI